MSETQVALVVPELGTLAEQAPKVAEAVAQVERLSAQLPALEAEAKRLEVKHPDRAAYARAGELLSTERMLSKQGEAYMAPFNVLAARLVTALRTITQKHTNACAMIDAILKPKMKVWEIAEKAATEKEQKQEDKKAARRGEDAPTVQNNTPSVAGYRRSTLYRCEVEDAAKFWRAFLKDPSGPLARFVRIDQEAMQRVFREETKDIEKMSKMCPGVKFWTE